MKHKEFIIIDRDNFLLDPNKKNIGVFSRDYGKCKNYHTRFSKTIVSEIKKYYNIIFFSTEFDDFESPNTIKMNEQFSDLLYRSTETDHFEKNDKIIFSSILGKITDKFEYIINFGGFAFQLPALPIVSKKIDCDLSYRLNEYFDYVGDDKNKINLIKEYNRKIVTNISRKVSPLAFSQKRNNFYYMITKALHDAKLLEKGIINIIDDPIVYTPFFEENNIPHKTFYFADDFRGTRKFHTFDHAQIQHIISDEDVKKDSLLSSIFIDNTSDIDTMNFCFFGTVFQEKKTARAEVYNTFLKDFYYEKSSYFIPIKKNWVRLASPTSEKDLCNVKQINNEMYENIINHPLYAVQDEFPITTKTLRKYKYSLVARCVSYSDSLNFRPVFFTISGTLPLIDYKYDPSFVQIPKHISDQLIVHDHHEMKARIDYFEKHQDERVDILNELRKLFRINEWETNPKEMLEKEVKKLFY